MPRKARKAKDETAARAEQQKAEVAAVNDTETNEAKETSEAKEKPMTKAERDRVIKYRLVQNATLRALHKALEETTWDAGEKPTVFDASVLVATQVLAEVDELGWMVCRYSVEKAKESPDFEKAKEDGSSWSASRLTVA